MRMPVEQFCPFCKATHSPYSLCTDLRGAPYLNPDGRPVSRKKAGVDVNAADRAMTRLFLLLLACLIIGVGLWALLVWKVPLL